MGPELSRLAKIDMDLRAERTPAYTNVPNGVQNYMELRTYEAPLGAYFSKSACGCGIPVVRVKKKGLKPKETLMLNRFAQALVFASIKARKM